MKFLKTNIENWRFWKSQFFFESAIFCFIPMKTSQSFLVSKDQAKRDNIFWHRPNILRLSVSSRVLIKVSYFFCMKKGSSWLALQYQNYRRAVGRSENMVVGEVVVQSLSMEKVSASAPYQTPYLSALDFGYSQV